MAGSNGRQSVEPRGGKSTTRGKGMTINERAALERAARSPRTPNKTATTKAKSAPTPPSKPTKKAVERKAAAEQKRKAQELKAREALKGNKVEEEVEGGEGYIWVSLVVFFVAGFLLLSTISYLMYWEADAPRAFFSGYFDAGFSGTDNWGGRLGAILGNHIIGGWVGVPGVFLSLFFFMLGLRVLRVETLKFKRSMPALIGLILVSSLVLAHIYGTQGDVFGSGWGGRAGINVDRWLRAMIGDEGTSLLILFVAVAILFYSFTGWFTRGLLHLKHCAAKRAKRRMEAREWQRQRRAEAMVKKPVQEDKEDIKTEVPAPIENTKEVVAEPEPEQNREVELPFIPTVIALEGGLLGYHYGYGAEGEALYYYFDNMAFAPQNVTPQVIENLQIEEEVPEEEFILVEKVEEQPIQTQDIEFIIEQPVQESPLPQQPTPSQESMVEVTPAKKEIAFEVENAVEDEKLPERAINNMELYDPTAELPNYKRPALELLQDHTRKVDVTQEELSEKKDRIIYTLQTFGIKIKNIKATVGPTVTLYEIVPEDGVRISKIKNLENDIALALAALGIRIIAPIPGKGTIGIEVPNTEKETVSMHSVIRAAKFQEMKAELPIALGKTISNETFVIDLAKMPHLLVAGATGQGKSVGLNAIITSLLYKKHPSELKFVLVDPKKVELTLYSHLEKHFLAKMEGEEDAIITENQKVVYTLNSICQEMDARYDLLKAAQVRNIVEYNNKFTHRRLNPEKGHRFLPYFVVIIDEFADLIMTAGREVETPIARIAQLARAVGIHLIIATQRPTTNIITGMIKANFPARIAFKVTSMIDSRTILDSPGANQLIGRGDMLVHTGSEMTRVQCAFIDTPEVEDIVKYISAQRGYISAYELPEFVPEGENSPKEVDMTRRDPLFSEVARFVVSAQVGSASTIQRKFAIGFNRAGRIVDQLEATGIVGPQVGSKARQVLIQDPVSLEMMLDD